MLYWAWSIQGEENIPAVQISLSNRISLRSDSPIAWTNSFANNEPGHVPPNQLNLMLCLTWFIAEHMSIQ